MNKLWTYVLLVASFSLLMFGCSNKNSNEACVHQVTMDLDKGNYDAVIASGCADSMQKGAAYLGKAGFDISKLIIRLSEANSTSSTAGSSTSNFTQMTSLVGVVDDTTIADLGNSKLQYLSVPATSDSYKDAQFFVGLVDMVKGLALIKSIADVVGDGTLNTTCDKNNNTKPDALDTASCALLVGANHPVSQCTPTGTPAGSILVVSDTTAATVTLKSSTTGTTLPGTYRGMIIEASGTGTNISGCQNPNQYKYLLILKSGTTNYSLITTASGTQNCVDSAGKTWPCPILDENGNTLDLVVAFDSSLTSAIASMNTSLSSGTTTTSNDVSQSLTNIKINACPSGPCTSENIATYLQSYK